MEESSLINPEIKEYCKKHQIEDNLNKIIQEILTSLPPDPYSKMCAHLRENSSKIFKINEINLIKKLSSEFKYILSIEIYMSYKGNSQKAITYDIPTSSQKVNDLQLKEPDKIIQIFNKCFKEKLSNLIIEQFASTDKYISSLVDLNLKNEEEKEIGYSLANNISISILLSMCNLSGTNTVRYIQSSLDHFIVSNNNIPDIGFVIFKTGKTMNSKVKFERFILFIDNSTKIPKDELKCILEKLYLGIRKSLTSGKQGEAGMKLNAENSYIPLTDTLNDILKTMETIISEAGGDGKLYYGIDCNANNYYDESTGLYEMEGFKKPPDSDQLIEFYLKLCNDHPLIKYIEDPLSNKDLSGWGKLLEKFSTTLPNVKLSCKELINDNLAKLIEITEKKDNEGQNSPGKLRTTDPKYRSRIINNVPTPEDIKYEYTELEKIKLKQQEEENNKKAEEEEAKKLAEEEKKKEEDNKKQPGKKIASPPDKKKIDEESKKEAENNEKFSPSLLPLKIDCISTRIGNFKCFSELLDIFKKCKDKKIQISLYDNIYESNQGGIIDLGISFRVNRIILYGYTNNYDVMSKVLKYLDLVEELY